MTIIVPSQSCLLSFLHDPYMRPFSICKIFHLLVCIIYCTLWQNIVMENEQLQNSRILFRGLVSVSVSYCLCTTLNMLLHYSLHTHSNLLNLPAVHTYLLSRCTHACKGVGWCCSVPLLAKASRCTRSEFSSASIGL